ncbi:proteoglycan 4a [Scomber scombrus]|uniref:Proteoglycan 4a n=1 Tax=Scomber scombrus TaxID=13677 RepID=A0AAV1PG06_SCOSC
MMRMMMKMWLLLLGCAVTYTAAVPGSCVGRCGELFTRGQQCNCDLTCQQHNECCQDFQAVCTSVLSCQGRCGEAFKRGRTCECDAQCTRFNTCCHDYQLHCDASVPISQQRSFQPLRTTSAGNRKSKKGKKKSNSESEEWSTGMSNIAQLPESIPYSHGGALDSPAYGSSLPSHSAQSRGFGVPAGPFDPANPSGPGSPSDPAVVNVHLVLSHGGPADGGPLNGGPLNGGPYNGGPYNGGPAPSGTIQDLLGLTGPSPRPSTLEDVAQALGTSLGNGGPQGAGAGLLIDINLCSDAPMNGLTALSNGTILIFKGELFWSVDPVTRSAAPAQSIADILGVPSPIDTVFTRSNCHGNTYIIKGDQYWRFDKNMMLEPGFPKPLTSEFPGLMGGITAALSLPATKARPETIYFFKNGDLMQKFTYPPGSTPPCNMKSRSPQKSRPANLAEGVLGAVINLKVSLKGFPSPITAALSMPSPQRSDKYHQFVFSGPLYFKIQISGDLPALAKPDPSAVFAPLPIFSPPAGAPVDPYAAAPNANPPQLANSIKVWLRCN